MEIVLLKIFFFYVFIEIALIIFIKYSHSKIPWIITDKDEFPEFKKNKLKLFFKNTYDSRLGWNWKPNTKYNEKIFGKINTIFYGKIGERKSSKKVNNKTKYHFASFGDSFVFCRYVKNSQTWQENLAKLSHRSGLNLGVGNYGLDQIYLKYTNTKLPKNIKTVFIGFVPETLSRCLCSWKHYHEFKNIYAFKPKFINSGKSLKLIPNPIKNENSFENIKEIIQKLKKKEFFYNEKFNKSKFYFPYLFSILKNPKYNLKLIFYSILKILNINNNKIYKLVIKKNCIKNDFYFSSKKNNQLLKKLMLKIEKKSKERKHKIVFLIFPQKYDLSLKKKNYIRFFNENKKKFNVLDFSNIFYKEKINQIYLPDQYGGHLSAYGNKLVAKTILKEGYI